MCQFH